MSNSYWNDRNNMQFFGDAKDKQLTKGKPNDSKGQEVKHNASFQEVPKSELPKAK